jgi:hypothetical protein
LAGSPAIDAGNDALLSTIAQDEHVAVANATDQTGNVRLFGGHIDIGAVEYHPAAIATALQFVPLSATTTAGQGPGTVQVDVLDQFGNFLTSDNSDQVTLSGAPFPAGNPLTVTVQSGMATFSNLVIDTAGSYTLSAASGTLTGAQTSLKVVPAATSKLAVTGFPPSISAGVAGKITVTAEDAFGNLTPTYTGTVHISSSDKHAVLPANATLTNGVGTFSVTLKTARTQSITATDTVTATITGSQAGITVNPAAAKKLVLSGIPASVTAGKAFTVKVTAEDAFGNVATGYAGTVHLSSSDAKAVLPPNIALSQGVGTFSVTLETARSQSLTAKDTVTATIFGTKAGIKVVPGAPAALLFLTEPSNVVAGQPITPAVRVESLDAFGNVATHCTNAITIKLAANPGGTTLGGTTTVKAVKGVATFSNLTLGKPGTGYSLEADSGTLTVRSSSFDVL